MARIKNVEVLGEIDEKIGEITELIDELQASGVVKRHLTDALDRFYEEAEDSVDLRPTDWE